MVTTTTFRVWSKQSNIDVLKIGTKYDYKAFKIVPIKLYHDAPQCGYRIFWNDFKVIYATDTKTLEGISAKIMIYI